MIACALVAAFTGGPACAEPGRGVTPTPQLQLEAVATGLSRPLLITHAGDGSGRLFIAEQQGPIRIVRDGILLPTPFLDVDPISRPAAASRGCSASPSTPTTTPTATSSSYYTDNAGDTVVARYQVSAADPDVADPDLRAWCCSTQDQPFSNHNGGQIAFGPDGYLYVGLGDGGSGGDPLNSGQSLDTLLGKLLRLDVDGDDFPSDPDRNYAVPATNPFVGDPVALPEIWACGPAQPLALQLRPPDRRPVHRRRRPEPVGGGQLPARREPRRRELRLAPDGGHPLLQPLHRLQRRHA